MVAPVLVLLAMGVIDFASVYNNWSGMRQGVWAGARAGSVATFGAGATCPLTFSGGGSAPSADLQSLMCLAKGQIGLSQSSVRIDILISDPTLQNTGASWQVGGGLTICAQAPLASATGALGSALSGHWLRSKTTIRIEQASPNIETQGYEVDSSGQGWAWCTAQNTGS